MAIVCPNGHVNDDANRFCDQCGLPLTQGNAAAQSVVASAPATSGTGSASIVCPVCGQENVPGTAFCDNCGAALPPPAPVAGGDTAAPVAAADSGAGGATVTCPQCGAANDAANRFCDNCGAALSGAAAPDQAVAGVDQTMTTPDGVSSASTPLPTEGTTVPSAPDAATTANDSAVGADLTSVPSLPPTPETTAPPAADIAASNTGTAVAPEEVLSVPGGVEAGPPLQSQPASSGPDTATGEADRVRLEQEIATQQQLVTQLEQMEAQFGAAMPPALRQGLDEARAALARAQAELDALPPARPPVDPAEVARLEQEIATQQQLVTQLEQMEAQFGAAMPPALRQGLDEARAALARAQAELSNLTGAGGAGRPLPSALDVALQKTDDTAAPAAGPRTYDASAAPAAQPEPPVAQPEATAAQAPPPVGATVPAAPPARGTDQLPPAPAAPQASGPRLISRDGTPISLPDNIGDLIIGREDPVSGIHPEVDLTPYGGEAGGVSRRHAMLRIHNGQWMLTDLDSTNYTRVDGNRITPNTPTMLRDGARVQFGRVEFEFRT